MPRHNYFIGGLHDPAMLLSHDLAKSGTRTLDELALIVSV